MQSTHDVVQLSETRLELLTHSNAHPRGASHRTARSARAHTSLGPTLFPHSPAGRSFPPARKTLSRSAWRHAVKCRSSGRTHSRAGRQQGISGHRCRNNTFTHLTHTFPHLRWSGSTQAPGTCMPAHARHGTSGRSTGCPWGRTCVWTHSHMCGKV